MEMLRRALDRVSRFYVYKLTTDNGGAPCVHRGLLSLAICKPRIRRRAQEGDWIFGFGGKDLGDHVRLIYIAQVTKHLPNGCYFVDEGYEGRPDRIYRRDGERFVWKQGAKYHKDGTELEHDLGKLPRYARAVTLLSENFRYWGKKGSYDCLEQFPAVGALLDRLGRGHRVNLSDAETCQLRDLQTSQWQKYPQNKVLGPPTQGDWSKPCNRSEGSVGCASPKSADA